MKKLLTIFLLFPLFANGTIYYISNAGSNANAGTSEGASWQTLAKLNSVTLVAGDIVKLKRGDTWAELLTVNQSGSSGNPITYTSYGTGAKPIITGFTTVTAWTSLGSNIYESTSAVTSNTTLNMVTFQDTLQPMGRWPKVTDANGGYLLFQSHSGLVSFTSNAIASALSYVGGEVVIRKKAWIIDRARVNSQSSTVVGFTSFVSPAHPTVTYDLTDGYGFFFQNHSNACTVLGEWAYDSTTRKIRMNFTGGTPASYAIKVSSLESVVSISSKNYITFDSIQFIGSNSKTFNINVSNFLEIRNCDFDLGGVDVIWCNSNAGATNLSFHDNTVNHTNNNVMDLGEGADCSIRNNVINNTGMNAGMGVSGDKTYLAIIEIDNGATVEYNYMTNMGYSGVYFSGDDVLIKNNVIINFNMVKEDGAAIYAYAQTTKTNRVVTGNICINSPGNPYGHGLDLTFPYNRGGHGIYMDGGTRNVTISDNTIANCRSTGLVLQSVQGVTVTGNTIYNSSRSAVDMPTDNYPIASLTFTGNILFAKEDDQSILKIRLSSNYLATMGTFNNNYYCRPISEVQGINTTGYSNGSDWTFPFQDGGINEIHVGAGWRFYSLDTWKTLSSQDAATVKTYATVTDTSKIRFEYNPTNATVNVSLGAFTYYGITGTAYSNSVDIPAYSSIILLNPVATGLPGGGGIIIKRKVRYY